MATPTYELIDSQVLSTSAASVTFSSIPATYRDLVLVVDIIPTAAYERVYVRFNSDTGSNYNGVYARGNGTTATSGSGTDTSIINANITALIGEKTLLKLEVLDYSATDKHKTALARANNADYATDMGAYRWANTSAITAVEVFTTVISYAAGSTFYLYGVAA